MRHRGNRGDCPHGVDPFAEGFTGCQGCGRDCHFAGGRPDNGGLWQGSPGESGAAVVEVERGKSDSSGEDDTSCSGQLFRNNGGMAIGTANSEGMQK